MGINKSAYVLGTRRHGSHFELQRKFDCNLRVAIQNGIHAGPVETVTTWHDGAVPLPQLRSTMFGGIGLKRLQHGMTELCHYHSSAVPCLVELALALALAL